MLDSGVVRQGGWSGGPRQSKCDVLASSRPCGCVEGVPVIKGPAATGLMKFKTNRPPSNKGRLARSQSNFRQNARSQSNCARSQTIDCDLAFFSSEIWRSFRLRSGVTGMFNCVFSLRLRFFGFD
eukprot:scaffold11183_cov102-Isochrysis_galbana.AAC.3